MCCPCPFLQVDGISLCLDSVLPTKSAILRKYFLFFAPVLSHNACGQQTQSEDPEAGVCQCLQALGWGEWKQVMFSDESQEHGGLEERDHCAVDPEDEG